MRLKILKAILLILLFIIFGSDGEGMADNSPDHALGMKGRYPVIYPPKSSLQFPEDQVIKKEFEVTTQWQTIIFQKPLRINRQGLMGLHLAVDQEPYISTMDDHPLNPECNTPDCVVNAFCLRRLSDGVLIRPEAILIGDNGVEVRVRSDGHLYPYFDKHIMTIALRTFKDADSPPPEFPVGIKAFTAMRIRSTAPFLVRYLYWNVDRHPEIFLK